MSGVTPDDVLEFKDATEGFLCGLDANTYGLTFDSFVMKDYDTKEVIFEISADSPLPALDLEGDFDEDSLRRIRYDFSVDVLRKETVSTTLVFSNGPEPLEDFRMIERHYFRDVLIKSFDFDFGFVIPNTTNTWESVYTLPTLPESLIEEIIQHPYEVKSDSFYFSKNKLILHNKAEYRYFKGTARATAALPPTDDGVAGGKEPEDTEAEGKWDDGDGKTADEEDSAANEGKRSDAAPTFARRSHAVGSSKLADSDDDR